MRSYRVALETVTALIATTVAGLSLALPIDFGWTAQTSALQLDLLAYSLPRAVAAGVLVAMIVAVLVTTMGSIVAAWGTAAAGLVVLLLNHFFGHASDPTSSLATLNFIDSIAGGIVMGALGAAVLHHRLPAFGWTLGALISLLLGSVNPLPRVGANSLDRVLPEHWQASNTPPLWMIEVALALVVIGLLVNRNRPASQKPSIELPLAPILAGVVLVLVTLVSAEWLARHGGSAASVGLAVLSAIATGLIAAMLLPGRDGELVLVGVALVSVGSATIAAELPAWSIPLLVAVGALGMWSGSNRRTPMLCLALLVVLGMLTAFTEETDWAIITVGSTAALAWLFGFGLTAATPRYVPSRVLGTMVIFVPSAALGLRDYVSRGHYALQGTDKTVCTVTPENSSAPAWAAVLIALGCAGGVAMLRHSRPVTPPSAAASEHDEESSESSTRTAQDE
ncbi:hypothetical protein [Nocardia jejuensis]|uniref:hypothetical protein n=1 Tax=Nocardia jejuensis TaxID=328049 RepID=UPI000A5B17F7|nr:hypothetical protein [Nocardia jejuensis]